MTPKEKAQELITKFNPLVTTWDCYWDTPRNEDDIIVDAKKCALIAVDEILEAVKNCVDREIAIPTIIYWEKVKQEIEKL